MLLLLACFLFIYLKKTKKQKWRSWQPTEVKVFSKSCRNKRSPGVNREDGASKCVESVLSQTSMFTGWETPRGAFGSWWSRREWLTSGVAAFSLIKGAWKPNWACGMMFESSLMISLLPAQSHIYEGHSKKFPHLLLFFFCSVKWHCTFYMVTFRCVPTC